MPIKVIITGSTGMVGEGVLFECLKDPNVLEVLMVNRRHYDMKHPKLTELILSDFFKAEDYANQLSGYDACFYCAGISSVGMSEEKYTYITYDTTLSFASTLAKLNPDMIFNFVTGAQTDSSEKGKLMRARVKGRTENALMKLPFKKAYNFRPSIMKPTKGQKNIGSLFVVINAIYPVLAFIFPKSTCLISDIGKAMIKSATKGYPKQILEVSDIKALATLKV